MGHLHFSKAGYVAVQKTRLPLTFYNNVNYSKTCEKPPFSKRAKIGFQDQLSLSAGEKYCRMLQREPLEHSAKLSTFIELQLSLSAGSDKIHAKSKFLSTWWSTDFSKNYTVGRLMGLLFSPNLFFLKSFALLRKSGLCFLTIILTFSLKSTGK